MGCGSLPSLSLKINQLHDLVFYLSRHTEHLVQTTIESSVSNLERGHAILQSHSSRSALSRRPIGMAPSNLKELVPGDDVFLQDAPGPTVAEHAMKCNRLFMEYMDRPEIARDPTLIDDQLARFKLWASNMDVFGPSNISLDYRLRYSPTVVQIIHQLLDVICSSLESRKLSRLQKCINKYNSLTGLQIDSQTNRQCATASKQEETTYIHSRWG